MADYKKDDEHESMKLQTIILVALGTTMIVFSAVSLFLVPSHEALLTSFVVLGAALAVAGCFLPRMGGDFEIGPKGIKGKLKELDNDISIAENQIPRAEAVENHETLKTSAQNQDSVGEVLELALVSPAAALLMLSRHIEYETKSLLSTAGWLPEGGSLSFAMMLRELELRKLLPASLLSSVGQFRQIRNSVAHAAKDTPENEVSAAIESGVSILKMIQAIPRENHHVHKTGITLYGDPTAKHPMPGVSGVILNNTRPSGLGSHKSIHPTTRNDYKVGQQLGWQWNLNRVYPEAWYKDPDDDNKIKSAWLSSGEFTGEIIPTV